MKNRCLILLTVLALLASFPMTVLAAGAGLTVSSVEAMPGETVTLSVIMTGNPGFCYLKVNYTFDADKLEFVNAENGTVSTDEFTVAPNAILWDAGADAMGDGTLVDLTFAVKDGAEGTAAVGLTVSGCFNYDEETVDVAVTDGAIRIKGQAAQPFIKGDVDGDLTVTPDDARLALRAAVQLESYAPGSRAFLAADVDENNLIETSDARYILRASVQLEDLNSLPG